GSTTGRARPSGPGPPAAPGLALSTEPERPFAPQRCAPEPSAASPAFSPLARPTREIGPSRARAIPEDPSWVASGSIGSASSLGSHRVDRSVLTGYVCIAST